MSSCSSRASPAATKQCCGSRDGQYAKLFSAFGLVSALIDLWQEVCCLWCPRITVIIQAVINDIIQASEADAREMGDGLKSCVSSRFGGEEDAGRRPKDSDAIPAPEE